MMTMMTIMMMMVTMITIFSVTVTLLHRILFGFFVNYLFVHHFVVYLLIQSTILPFLLSYDLISLNFKTDLKLHFGLSTVCSQKRVHTTLINDPARQKVH